MIAGLVPACLVRNGAALGVVVPTALARGGTAAELLLATGGSTFATLVVAALGWSPVSVALVAMAVCAVGLGLGSVLGSAVLLSVLLATWAVLGRLPTRRPMPIQSTAWVAAVVCSLIGAWRTETASDRAIPAAAALVVVLLVAAALFTVAQGGAWWCLPVVIGLGLASSIASAEYPTALRSLLPLVAGLALALASVRVHGPGRVPSWVPWAAPTLAFLLVAVSMWTAGVGDGYGNGFDAWIAVLWRGPEWSGRLIVYPAIPLVVAGLVLTGGGVCLAGWRALVRAALSVLAAGGLGVAVGLVAA